MKIRKRKRYDRKNKRKTKKKYMMLKRKQKRKFCKRQQLESQKHKYNLLSVCNTTYGEWDEEDICMYSFRHSENESNTRYVYSRFECEYGSWYRVKDIVIGRPYAQPIPLCDCCTHTSVLDIQRTIESFRALLMCLQRQYIPESTVLFQISYYIISSFLIGRNNIYLKDYMEKEVAYYKTIFLKKYQTYASQIKKYTLKYERSPSEYDSEAYRLSQYKRIFTKYDWKQFRSTLLNIFPRHGVIFKNRNPWKKNKLV